MYVINFAQVLMQQLKAAGMEKVLLGVDAENPSGATRLYESVGFRRQPRTRIDYIKQLYLKSPAPWSFG